MRRDSVKYIVEYSMNAIPDHNQFGLGAYSIAEAARLLRISTAKIRRWVNGYKFATILSPINHLQPPLWATQYPKVGDDYYLGFKDLIELKIVKAFLDQGVSLQTVRKCLQEARAITDDTHPFTTTRFKSDGETIFLDQVDEAGAEKTLDLKRRQYVIRKMIEQSFKDLDLTDRTVASWRPFNGKKSIIIDPLRSFGQPIANDFGIPTIVLRQALEAEGSIQSVSRLYEIPPSVIRDAVAFEVSLEAA